LVLSWYTSLMSWKPTHQTVADELDLTVATVSRIRTGARLPSLETMQKITKLTGWTLDSQVSARDNRRYAMVFNDVLGKWSELVTVDGD